MNKLTVKDVDVKGKRVLVRCDFNVPMKEGKITDENRIIGALPTIKYLLEQGAKVILCSHLGRPKGEFNLKYSLSAVANRLNELLDGKVTFANDVIGEDATQKVNSLKSGEAVLLENLRFHKEEEKNDREFCSRLASFCDVYVNDAFGTAHRAHASTAGIVEYGFVKTAVAGTLIAKELEIIGGALENANRPFVAVLGGSKVSDKIGVIENLLKKVDTLLIGGGMAYTFLRAMGLNVGKSLVEEDKIELAKNLMELAKQKGVNLVLPADAVACHHFPDPIDDESIIVKTVSVQEICDDDMCMDIGERTSKEFFEHIIKAKTVIWNGPMGVFENPILSKGTKKIAEALKQSSATTIVGGGDSAAAIEQFGYSKFVSHISTGGGASLEFMEGKVLPGVACLNDKN